MNEHARKATSRMRSDTAGIGLLILAKRVPASEGPPVETRSFLLSSLWARATALHSAGVGEMIRATMFSRILSRFAVILLALVATASAASAAVKIAVIGDSTVCEYPANSPNRGWGHFIGEYFRDNVTIVNLAASGRSTKTFLSEGRWAKTLAEKPQFILIQFGHNDSHAKEKPEATDAATDYRDNLRRYVREAREAKAVPIFVTPMQRRNYKADGSLDDILLPYADAMKAVAAELHVPVVDLHAMSGDLYRKLGREKSLELANKPGDATHFGEKGARAMAELVMSQLPTAVPELKPLLKAGK
jgi:lysophospholipase L1-like esterase